jgi:hypothetical protein
MKVAVSGTHCCGKTTLIERFLLAHPDFAHEPEPYIVLQEDYGDVFAAEPSAEDFYRQLEFNIDRLQEYPSGERVIFERSPVDFLAYLLALKEVGRGESATGLIQGALDMVKEAIQHLDLIVFLPLNDEDGMGMPESEDPELRSAVNDCLVGLFNEGDFNLFTLQRPIVLEAIGSTAQRLRMMESALTK